MTRASAHRPRPALDAAPAEDPARRGPWRELTAILMEGPASAEDRLEALIDHVERGARR